MTKLRLEIVPHDGVGPLRFGMTNAEVRGVMPDPATPFMKVSWATQSTDAFKQSGIHVYYDDDGLCDAVELMSPAEPTLQGVLLVGVAFCEARRFVEGLGGDVMVDDDGLTSLSLGMAMYCPAHTEDPRAPIEGVLVFRRGYYSRDSLETG